MKRITDDLTLSRLHTRGEGFIYNDFAGKNTGREKYNVLHCASCYWNGRSNANVPKVFFEELDEAVVWLNENRGAEGQNWKHCGSCMSGSRSRARRQAATQAPPITPAPQSPAGREPLSEARAHYLIHLDGAESTPVVEAWSEQRLPFEPKGWLMSFRADLQQALAKMEAVPGQMLYAVYGSAVGGHFDLENVLFYNVGTHSLNRAGRYGVRFERRFTAPPPTQSKQMAMPHYHRYALAATDSQFEHWQNGIRVARWSFTVKGNADLLDCARVWLA